LTPASGASQAQGHWSGRQVLNAGETLAVSSNKAGSVSISGYTLSN
jgi:hypothetical protein